MRYPGLLLRRTKTDPNKIRRKPVYLRNHLFLCSSFQPSIRKASTMKTPDKTNARVPLRKYLTNLFGAFLSPAEHVMRARCRNTFQEVAHESGTVNTIAELSARSVQTPN